MVEISEVEAKIRAALPDAQLVTVEDLTGTKDHLSAVVVSPSFAGMTRVSQHQTIYRALSEWMHGPIHALALQTYTPDDYAARKG